MKFKIFKNIFRKKQIKLTENYNFSVCIIYFTYNNTNYKLKKSPFEDIYLV